jgi:hypothetical protein
VALEIKIESLLARGEFSTQERDRLLAALGEAPPTPVRPRTERYSLRSQARLRRKRLITPLRIFLVGVLCGLGIAYLVWGLFGSPLA